MSIQNYWLIGMLAAVAVAIVVGIRIARRKGDWPHRISEAIKRVSDKALQDVVIPDGAGGQIHLDYLLLTVKGLVVLDIKDVVGNVFGSNKMDNWTVITNKDRLEFRNPQGPLYDRVAAVKTLASEVPVSGRIVFTERAKFPKGTPDHVVQLDALVAEFDTEAPEKSETVLEAFYPHWERVVSEIIDA